MGCGPSKEVDVAPTVSNKPRKSVVLPPPPEIQVKVGRKVGFPSPPTPRTLVIFGRCAVGSQRIHIFNALVKSIIGLQVFMSKTSLYRKMVQFSGPPCIERGCTVCS